MDLPQWCVFHQDSPGQQCRLTPCTQTWSWVRLPVPVTNRNTPFDSVRMGSPSAQSPKFLLAYKQVLAELSLPAALPINFRIQRFVTRPHPRGVRKIHGQSARNLFWCPPLSQPAERMVHTPIAFHSIRLMRKQGVVIDVEPAACNATGLIYLDKFRPTET